MEATSAIEPRGPERNGAPPVAVAGNGGAAVVARVRAPIELPAARKPGAATLVGLAATAAVGALALGVAGIVVVAGDDGSDGATSSEARRAVALLAKPSTERFPMRESERRVLLAVGSASRGFLVLRGLTPAPEGMAYEAWIVEEPGLPRPAALFSGEERLVALSRPVPRGATVGISLESEAGSDVPPTRFRFTARRAAP